MSLHNVALADMTTHSPPRLTLSFDQANRICREFLPIGEALFDYIHELQDAGFSAFRPLHEFTQSFCDAQSEIELHKQCLIEEAKCLLGRPFPFPIAEAEERYLFRSPLLQELSRLRDEENGVPLPELTSRYPEETWRLEIDPCRRRSALASVNERLAYQARWKAAQQEQRRQLETETARHASNLDMSYTFDRRQRYAFFSAVMEQNVTALGFEFDARRARTHYPIFSKRVSADWDLCWALEESKAFCSSAFEGRFAPYLEVRSRSLIGSIESRNTGEFLFIRYQQIVPGFSSAYGKFLGLRELETMIKAHLYLYSLMAPIVENGLKQVLG
jgi:hypothetical protein